MNNLKIYSIHEPDQPWHPWCIQVEFVQGCNRRCWFCGIQGMPKEKQIGDRYITAPILEKCFSDLNEWLPKIRVEVNSHGEPTLHPQFFEMVDIIRQQMPTASISIQTNTEYWITKPNQILDFLSMGFDAGVNTWILNAYKKGLYQWWVEFLEKHHVIYTDYYYGNISANKYYPPNIKQVVLFDDLGAANITHLAGKSHHNNKRIHNSGGNSNSIAIQKMTGKPIPKLPIFAKCSKVFRELILDYDGNIPICCQDWNDVHIMGNVVGQHLRDIWFGDDFVKARQLLYYKRRDMLNPCSTCDDPTTRVGLIEYADILGDNR